MTENQTETTAHVASGVTITIDPAQVLHAILGSGRYDYEADEEIPGGPVAATVVNLAAQQLARDLQPVVAEELRASVRDAVDALVVATLAEGVRPTDTWGTPKGEPTTVAGLVRAEVQAFLSKPLGDSMTRRGSQTALQKYVAEQVGNAFTIELRKEVDAAKAQALAAVRTAAADVFTETIAKAAALTTR